MDFTRRSVLGTGISAAAGLATGYAHAAGEPVRIGVLNDQSGPYSASMGRGSVIAANMAVEDFGPTVLGRPIEIMAADHQNSVDIGTSIARQWCDTGGVGLIIDIGHSAIALGVQDIVRARNKIAIYTAVGTTQITEQACSPNGFSWCYDAYALCNGLVSAMAGRELKTWFLLVTDYAFGHSLEEEVEAAVGRNNGRVVGRVRHPEHTNDFSAYILQALAAKPQPQVLGLLNSAEDMANSLKQATEFGFRQNGRQVAAPLVNITDVHSMGLELAQGLTFLIAFVWDRTDATRRFSERFMARHKAPPTMPQAAVYSGTLHYLRAVAAAGTSDTDPVIAAMRANRVRDVYAEDGWIRADGRMMHDMYLVQVKAPNKSKGPWDYSDILSTVPADKAFRLLSESKCPLVHS
ncbi:ABC transporter substrate-binding protein [Acidisphaera sp. L21]|uniref:ABC transporter substrate-binding protein n=1 Tax=Acidisphaera sp. L21 TaxID=1641851 RepID=UPI00131B336D|nr:ABC transporter substrate-binding protein [Acidisphaera sp. L21]